MILSKKIPILIAFGSIQYMWVINLDNIVNKLIQSIRIIKQSNINGVVSCDSHRLFHGNKNTLQSQGMQECAYLTLYIKSQWTHRKPKQRGTTRVCIPTQRNEYTRLQVVFLQFISRFTPEFGSLFTLPWYEPLRHPVAWASCGELHRPQNDPGPEMIPKLDPKLSQGKFRNGMVFIDG